MHLPKIASIATYTPPFSMPQANIELLTKELFQNKIPKLERLLKVFENGQIETRHFCVPASGIDKNILLKSEMSSISI